MSAIGSTGASSKVKIKEEYAKFVGGKVFLFAISSSNLKRDVI